MKIYTHPQLPRALFIRSRRYRGTVGTAPGLHERLTCILLAFDLYTYNMTAVNGNSGLSNDLLQQMPQLNVEALWTKMAKLNPPVPSPKTVPRM